MKIPIKIVLIGAGNLASHLLNAISLKKEIECIQIFNHRTSTQAKVLAKKYNSNFVTDFSRLNTDADLYIIGVKDEAIKEVAQQLKNLNLKGVIVHTSGSIDLSVLKGTSSNTGVFYPLQTFSKNDSINWELTPILIEGNSKKSQTTLITLGKLISKNVKTFNSKKRLQFHLAAVFACNFTNTLINSSFKLIEKEIGKKDSKLLMPIINQSIKKLDTLSPTEAQTGPALRGDAIVMKKHLALLKSNKELTVIYKLLSKLIILNTKN